MGTPVDKQAPVAVIVSTHTARHLRRTLMGVSCQTRRPDWVVVACDTDEAELLGAVRSAAGEFGLGLLVVSRAFTGRGRSSQVRNNGVRALVRTEENLPGSTRLVFLDGDCCPAPDLVAQHCGVAARTPGDLVIGFRIDLTESQTAEFSEEHLRRGLPPVEVSPEQRGLLESRYLRYRRQLVLRRFGLCKPHKPKLLSANFSVSLGAFAAVNGFDESYEDYGQEDDDLGRRLYRSGCRAALGIREALAYHQYHPTRAPQKWDRSPNAARFLAGGPVRCRLGLEEPTTQPEPRVERVSVATRAEPGRISAAIPTGHRR